MLVDFLKNLVHRLFPWQIERGSDCLDLAEQFHLWRASLRQDSPEVRIALTLLLALLGIFGAKLMRCILRAIYRRLQKHLPEWLRLLCAGFLNPLVLLFRFCCFYLALYALPLNLSADSLLYTAAWRIFRIAVILAISFGLWNAAGMCHLLLRSAQNRLDLKTNCTMNRFFENIYRVVVVGFGIIAILNVFNFNVTALVTGAGLVGLTVSLAAQSTASNLISGVALVLEHPFGIGDWILVNNVEGTVEDISFRSTKIRTLDHALVTIENSTVCTSAITNVSPRQSRLWQFTVGVTYNTPAVRIQTLCKALSTMLCADSQVLPDTVEVSVDGFGASSIDIDVRCYVTTLQPEPFRALKNRLNLSVMQVMQQAGCEFAFPSTSVYFASDSCGGQPEHTEKK